MATKQPTTSHFSGATMKRDSGPSWGRQLRMMLAVYFVFVATVCGFFLAASSLDRASHVEKCSADTYREMEVARAEFHAGGMFRELKLNRLIFAECEHQRALIQEGKPCDAPLR